MSKSSSMNSFQATDLFLYTLKTSENGRLSMFSRGIERGQWHELDYVTHGRFIWGFFRRLDLLNFQKIDEKYKITI